jgi:hypothetical protein
MRNELTERIEGRAMLFPSESLLDIQQLPVPRCKFA